MATLLSAKEQKLLTALEEAASGKGVEIVTVEVIGSKKSPTVRIYLDAEGGVSFDELTAAHGWINELMDKLDPFPGAYVLEVSSPGLDRPLRTRAHFERFAGETAIVKTRNAIDGRMSFTGTIVLADDEDVVINVDGTDYEIPYKEMKRANLKCTLDF